jgi:hypothetical protein
MNTRAAAKAVGVGPSTGLAHDPAVWPAAPDRRTRLRWPRWPRGGGVHDPRAGDPRARS